MIIRLDRNPDFSSLFWLGNGLGAGRSGRFLIKLRNGILGPIRGFNSPRIRFLGFVGGFGLAVALEEVYGPEAGRLEGGLAGAAVAARLRGAGLKPVAGPTLPHTPIRTNRARFCSVTLLIPYRELFPTLRTPSPPWRAPLNFFRLLML